MGLRSRRVLVEEGGRSLCWGVGGGFILGLVI